jgi:hypothetical protein
MSSSAKDDTGGAESAEDSNSVVEDSNSVSSKPEEDAKQPRVAKKKGSDTSSSGGTTTNEPSSTSAAATVVAGQPASQSEQPTIAAAAAAAAASPAPRSDQPRRPEFREQFQNTSATATEETVVERHSTSQSSGLPTFADAAAAAAPLVPLREKKPRRAGFREQFLQKVRTIQNTTKRAWPYSTSNDFCHSSFRLNSALLSNSSELCWIEKARMIIASSNGQLMERASSSLIKLGLRR